MSDILNWEKLKGTPCPPIEVLELYAARKLNRDEMYNVELHLSSCDYCSDIIEVLTENSVDTAGSLKQISYKVELELDKHFPQKEDLSSDKFEKKMPPISFKYVKLLIAACSIGVIFSIGFYFYKDNSKPPIDAIANSDIEDIVLKQAIMFNNDQEYDSCITLLTTKTLEPTDPMFDEKSFQLWNAYWKNNEKKKADSVVVTIHDIEKYRQAIERIKQK